MALSADSASGNHSPRSSGLSGEGFNSPQSRPWAHIVRGEAEAVSPSTRSSSPPVTAAQEQIPKPDGFHVKALSSFIDYSGLEIQSENSDNGNSNVGPTKKPVWNKPTNGDVKIGSVMGAYSWPALSESTRASPKSSSDSLKAADRSVSNSQGTVIASSPHKKSFNNGNNPNATPNHAFPVRQKSIKRGGGGGSGPANGHPPSPPPPPTPTVEMPHNNPRKPAPLVVPDSSSRDSSHKSNSTDWQTGPRGGFVSQHDHLQQRGSFKRGNGGHHSRGDGPYHNNHGGRREQARGNYEWNTHRSFNGRDVHLQQRAVSRTYIGPPPPGSTPFISPPHVRPYGNPVVFPDMTSPVYYVPALPPESFRGVPFIHAPPPMFFPAPDPQLRNMLVNQIHYYFSSENLCKDTFLRQNMDEQGWVPVSVISNFNRVKQLTSNVSFILDAVRSSTVVEVKGDKMRKRNDWMNWPPLPPSNQSTTSSGPRSPGIPNYEMLATRVQNVGLEDGKTTNYNTKAILSRSSSGELNSQSTTSCGEGTGQVTIQTGSD